MLSEEKLSKIIGDIADNYEQEDLFTIESGHQLPNRDAVIHIIMGLRQIMFPGYFDKEHLERTIPEYFLGHNIIRLYDTLSEQIRFALIREAKSQAILQRSMNVPRKSVNSSFLLSHISNSFC